ncbi:MAG: glycosyltransferase family 4 protein [Cyanothece sp. SIO1E1]|nr:glycosyltransferase family 4 protein [Cyanothece sp. SIO1E1]
MKKHYVFYTRDTLPQPNAAHLVHDVQSANAAANLGYLTTLVYLRKGLNALNPIDWLFPFRPQKPDRQLINFYQVQERLRVVQLSMPWPIDQVKGKLTNSSTIGCKYYFPVHIFPFTGVLHTLDWNLAKTAVKRRIPVIYEREHYQNNRYEPEIVNSPFFQVAVTVADPVRDNMIQNGMPSKKIVKLHLGYNQSFLIRQPQPAQTWRQQLLANRFKHLLVYAGALYRFKGVDLLIDVAKEFPQVQFALAGGDEAKVKAYQQLARDQHVNNVTFLGYIPHSRLVSLLQAADVLAHPHCSGEAATFTSPLKFFDYMASGTPIIATEIPPLMEFKASNIAANWCEPDNPAKFSDCLRQTLETYPRRVEGYSEGRDFVQQFSWESRVSKILKHIDASLLPALAP